MILIKYQLRNNYVKFSVTGKVNQCNRAKKKREILYITRHANEKHEERQQMEADRNGEEKKKKTEMGFRSQQYV